MSSFFDLVAKGGPIMIPIVGLSILTVACTLERLWFWCSVFSGEKRVAKRILEVARHDLKEARSLAEKSLQLPIARFLVAPLKLEQSTPETFRLALEAAGDREFIQMRKGDKLLETVIGVAPLLGLLGTVTGLIVTFFNLKIGGSGSAPDMSQAALGIAEALITTAGGMIVAVIALVVFRICVALQTWQIDYFSDIGNELELIYRHDWYERDLRDEV
jgi:biopolymer transport protein ExbB